MNYATQESRERQLRRDAKRVGFRIWKSDGYYSAINNSTNEIAFQCETLYECENFVLDHAKARGAMTTDGKWLVDSEGEFKDD